MTITRIVTTDTDEAPSTNDTYCLVEWTDTLPNHGTPTWQRRGSELTQDPRTNQSREARWSGWLGTTNDISEHAHGAYRVVSVTPWSRDSDPSPERPLWRVRLTEAVR